MSTIVADHMREVRNLFAEALSRRFGRSPEEIRAEGLGAGDFRSDESVDLELCDGSTMSLRYAFAIVDEARKLLGIFSEHCGYYCFGLFDVRLVERRAGAIVSDRRW